MTLSSRLRAAVYDAAIVGMTATWYAQVLQRLAPRCHLLDVGIGTGSALLANAALLREKALRVTGIDIDAAYIARCRVSIDRAGLADAVTARLESIYDHDGGPYEAAYFSGSFMLLPQPLAALRHVRSLLHPGSPIFFTQTFEHRPSPLLERIKPLLRSVTSIDFGRVTYEADFRRVVEEAGLRMQEKTVLHGSARRSCVLVSVSDAARRRGGGDRPSDSDSAPP
ncbi:MAG TPA: class I SAM-dependent methyltransferase [Candidatus Limnocylindrales bacterium]|nr:class I SAM-dependent methyltransferase [Candidatus Limnocylindrales bacterium]